MTQLHNVIYVKDYLETVYNKFYIDDHLPVTHNNQIIIALTSWTPRIEYVIYTLQSLLMQKSDESTYLRPHKIILTIAKDEFPSIQHLPTNLQQLVNTYSSIITVMFTEQMRSYKKILPLLKLYPTKSIITVDDTWYLDNFLKCFIDTSVKHPGNIIATLGCVKDVDKLYTDWDFVWNKSYYTDDTQIICPFGIGGVLYPPKSLHPITTNYHLCKLLADGNDDIWLWYMAKLNKTNITFFKQTVLITPTDTICNTDEPLWRQNKVLKASNIVYERLSKLFDIFTYKYTLPIDDLLSNNIKYINIYNNMLVYHIDDYIYLYDIHKKLLTKYQCVDDDIHKCIVSPQHLCIMLSRCVVVFNKISYDIKCYDDYNDGVVISNILYLTKSDMMCVETGEVCRSDQVVH